MGECVGAWVRGCFLHKRVHVKSHTSPKHKSTSLLTKAAEAKSGGGLRFERNDAPPLNLHQRRRPNKPRKPRKLVKPRDAHGTEDGEVLRALRCSEWRRGEEGKRG